MQQNCSLITSYVPKEMCAEDNTTAAEFDSLWSYGRFHNTVTKRTRYIRSPETERFLSTVVATSKNRVTKLRKGKVLWRAQAGHFDEENYDPADLPKPYSAERMKPLRNRATEGRANPKGIPYLYLATGEKAAILEVRPWIGSLVTVAKFKTLKGLKLADCSGDGPVNSYPTNASSADKESAVWYQINRAFSEPVTPSDNVAEYAPTQVIAETLRESGFDGVMYRSSLGSGRNIALFNVDAADPIDRFVCEVEKVRFTVGIRMNPSSHTEIPSGES